MNIEELTSVISQIIGDIPLIADNSLMDFTRADHREYFAGTIAHAIVAFIAMARITTPNTIEDK
jgi:hypothetical protein